MVPRMISAGKASATTIDRSRTTNGWRGSGRTASRGAARDAASASRSSSATKIASWRGAPRRRRSSARPGRRARAAASPTSDGRGLTGDEKRRASPARTRGATPSTSHSRSTSPLTSKKSTSRAGADQCSAVAAPVQAIATPRRLAVGCGEARADFEQPRRRGGRGAGCARRRRPDPAAATAAARRTWPTAGSRRATSCAASPSVGERLGGPRFDEAERHRLGQPGGRQHPPHQLVARRCAGRAAAPARSSTGTSARACRSRSAGRLPR